MQFMHNFLRCLLKKSDDVGPIDITKRGADVKSAPLGYVVSKSVVYFTSSKTTLTDYQCVSTGCCTHVAKTEITIDNQHVTKSLQRYRFLPE